MAVRNKNKGQRNKHRSRFCRVTMRNLPGSRWESLSPPFLERGSGNVSDVPLSMSCKRRKEKEEECQPQNLSGFSNVAQKVMPG